jgi:hypothetical protein
MSIITFPAPKSEVIVETGMMRQVINRTLAVHPLGALVVWYGESRMGKTTTAQFMAREILAAYDENNPLAFRAKYYEVGEIRAWSGNEMKKGIKSLYFAALGTPLDEGVYVKDPPEAIAARLVHELRKRNIQIIFIDEAGCLSIDAIWGMVLVRDVAKAMGWTLTLVFIGMDDLPQKMSRLAKLDGRVHEWCYFEEYNLKETWHLLKHLHTHFARLDQDDEKHQEQVKFLHETYGGFPGQLVPFIQRMEYRLQEYKGEIDLRFLRAVHLLTARDKQRSIQHSLVNYRGVPVERAAKKAAARVRRNGHERSNGDDSSSSPKATSNKSAKRK